MEILMLLGLAATCAAVAAWARITGTDRPAEADLEDLDGPPPRAAVPPTYPLQMIQRRGVPVVRVRPAADFGQGWLVFADGTQARVVESRLGDLGLLAVRLLLRPGRLGTVEVTNDALRVTLVVGSRELRLAIVEVVGPTVASPV